MATASEQHLPTHQENIATYGTTGEQAPISEIDNVSGAAKSDAEASGQPAEEVREYTEEEKLWNAVQQNPGDFQEWVNLIQETEKIHLEDVQKIRIAYDSFLMEFPLCYGYWKKYTDHEARFNEPGKVEEVFERAVIAVAYSVDMWMYYATYKAKVSADPDEVRSTFERGLAYVASDYLAHVLWDKYLEFETGKEEWVRVAQIYTRILQSPLQQLERYWRDFKTFAEGRSIHDIFTSEDHAQFSETPSVISGGPAEGSSAQNVPGTDGQPGAQADAGDAADSMAAEAPLGIKTEAVQMQEYVALREAYYTASRELDAKIRDHEMLIKRPYFHVKNLDDVQLAAWHRYLDLTEKDNDLGSIVKLYERCVIPTALYPEYWIRYVTKLEELGSLDRAQEALERASGVFLKRRPEIHLFTARYKESHEDIDGARSSLTVAYQLAPDLVETIVRFANFERRLGNVDSAKMVYESSIEAEKSKESSQILPFLYLQYARFIDQVLEDPAKALQVYTEASEKCPTSRNVWEALLSFQVSQQSADKVATIRTFLERLLAVPREEDESKPFLSDSDKEDIATVALEFIDLYGSARDHKQATQLVHSKVPPRRSGISQDSKKRSMTDDSAYGSALKVAKNGDLSGTAGYSAAVSGYGAWGTAGTVAAVAPVANAQAWAGYTAQAGAQAYAGYGQAGYAYAPAAAAAAAAVTPTAQTAAATYAQYSQGYSTAAAATTPAAYQAGYVAPTAAQAAYYPTQQGYYGQ